MFSDQQREVIRAYKRGESIAVDSVAGSGKTTTAVGAVDNAEGPASNTLSVAFNKRNAEDLASRMPTGVVSKTMNSLGNAAWKNHLGKWPRLDTNKLWGLLRTSKHYKELNEAEAAADVVQLVKLARHAGIASGYGHIGKPNYDRWLDLADEHGIDEADNLLPHAEWLLYESCVQAFQGVIDFDDQIYMPVMYSSPFQRYQRVVVDEAQDLSTLQHLMVQRSLAKDGQLAIFGDPNQAIYHFRGASSDSFTQMTEQFGLKHMPLSESFRCPRAVVRVAQKYVPHMQAAGSTEGSVTRFSGPLTLQPKLAVISRRNAPLIEQAFLALRQGHAVNFIGRDFMQGLKALHKKHPTRESLAAWLVEATSKSRTDGAEQRARDRHDTLMALYDQGDVGKAIETLEASASSGRAIIFSTVHKFKGNEADNVVFLNFTEPSFGRQGKNVDYVGVTRAKQNLLLHSEK